MRNETNFELSALIAITDWGVLSLLEVVPGTRKAKSGLALAVLAAATQKVRNETNFELSLLFPIDPAVVGGFGVNNRIDVVLLLAWNLARRT